MNKFFINEKTFSSRQFSISDEAFSFHKSLKNYSPTPVYNSKNLAAELNVGSLFVKDESQRFGMNAFKILGASFAIHKYLKENSDTEIFCTATDGNHGRAVARSAKQHNKKAVVFMPRHTVEERIQNIKNENAEVVIVDGDYDEATEQAKRFAKEKNAALIQDSSWNGYEDIPINIMNGYTTMMFELEAQIELNEIDFVFLQCGVGTWAAAAILFFLNRKNKPVPKFIVVEPNEADCMLESVKQKRIAKTTGSQNTTMAGLNCGTPAAIAFEILQMHADLFLAIDDEFVIDAMKNIYRDENKIVSGESGAAGLAALIALQTDASLLQAKKLLSMNSNSKVLLFNTEGDTDKINFQKIINE